MLPQGVDATLAANVVTIKGPKGTLRFTHHHEVAVHIAEGHISVEKAGNSKKVPAIWGTTTKMLSNLVEGVTTGFQKQLELNGVGFRMAVSGKNLTLALGFSHPVVVIVPESLEVKIENNVLSISGIDKQTVGQFAAEVRDLKPVEPYKGKGFRYVGEIVRRKEGKKASA
jgi:large subunit ribosomal protein L6